MPTPDKERFRKLWETFKSEGYEGLPELDEFAAQMSDTNNLKWAHSELIKHGYEPGSYEEMAEYLLQPSAPLPLVSHSPVFCSAEPWSAPSRLPSFP